MEVVGAPAREEERGSSAREDRKTPALRMMWAAGRRQWKGREQMMGDVRWGQNDSLN
jgi:hypothetical protein